MPSTADATTECDARKIGSGTFKVPSLGIPSALLVCTLLLMLWLRSPHRHLHERQPPGANCSQPFMARPCPDCNASDLLTALEPCLRQGIPDRGGFIFQLREGPRGLALAYSPPWRNGLGNLLSQYFQGLALATLAGNGAHPCRLKGQGQSFG